MKKALLILFAASLAAQAHAAAIEVGTNDFRISQIGLDGNANFDADRPDVVYNSGEDEYLVVFQGEVAATGEAEVFARRIDAATGDLIGDDFRVSSLGPDGNLFFNVSDPAVAYNSRNNEYLVVWRGDDATDNENEVYGQRLDASGSEIGTDDFRISDLGPNGDTAYGALAPDVAYNATDNQYLVVWAGDDNTAPLVNNEVEIFGQRLDAETGAEIGANDFRISDMGPDGNTSFAALKPQAAYNSIDNEYLVVWQADDDTAPLVNDEIEIFGQRLDAECVSIGANDFRISHAGTDGDKTVTAFSGGLVHNPDRNEYLVFWPVDDGVNFMEIFGRRLDADGAALGGSDFRISSTQAEGGQAAHAGDVGGVYNVLNRSTLVVWTESAKDGVYEAEVFGQALDTEGNKTGTANFRISDLGPGGDVNFQALTAGVAFTPSRNEYLVVWDGDDNTAPLVDEELEIFGQRLTDPKCGNAFVDSGEQCDDGNLAEGDGCSASCATEAAPNGSSGDGAAGGSGSGSDDGESGNGGNGGPVSDAPDVPDASSGGTGGGCSLIR